MHSIVAVELPDPVPGLKFWGPVNGERRYVVMVDRVTATEVHCRRWHARDFGDPIVDGCFAGAFRIWRHEWKKHACKVLLMPDAAGIGSCHEG